MDVPLLDGYCSIFLPNYSPRPGLGDFFGLLNLTLISELHRKTYDAILVHGYTYATHWLAFLASWATRTALFLRGESTLSDPRPWKVKIL